MGKIIISDIKHISYATTNSFLKLNCYALNIQYFVSRQTGKTLTSQCNASTQSSQSLRFSHTQNMEVEKGSDQNVALLDTSEWAFKGGKCFFLIRTTFVFEFYTRHAMKI